MTRLFTAVLFGLAVGVGSGVLSLLIQLAIAFARAWLAMRAAKHSGGLGAVSAPIYAHIVAIVGFVIGLLWYLLRSPATRQ